MDIEKIKSTLSTPDFRCVRNDEAFLVFRKAESPAQVTLNIRDEQIQLSRAGQFGGWSWPLTEEGLNQALTSIPELERQVAEELSRGN